MTQQLSSLALNCPDVRGAFSTVSAQPLGAVRGGAGRRVQPPTHEIRANPEIFWERAVNRQVFIDIMHAVMRLEVGV